MPQLAIVREEQSLATVVMVSGIWGNLDPVCVAWICLQ